MPMSLKFLKQNLELTVAKNGASKIFMETFYFKHLEAGQASKNKNKTKQMKLVWFSVVLWLLFFPLLATGEKIPGNDSKPQV